MAASTNSLFLSPKSILVWASKSIIKSSFTLSAPHYSSSSSSSSSSSFSSSFITSYLTRGREREEGPTYLIIPTTHSPVTISFSSADLTRWPSQSFFTSICSCLLSLRGRLILLSQPVCKVVQPIPSSLYDYYLPQAIPTALENRLTRNPGHSNCCRSHFYIDSRLRLCRKTTASKLFHQSSQAFKMALLDHQGQKPTPLHQKVGRQEHTGSRDCIQQHQCVNKRNNHTFSGRDLAKRWRQSQYVYPQHHDPSPLPSDTSSS